MMQIVKTKTPYLSIGIVIVLVGGFFGLQIPLKQKYDGIMNEATAATQFVAHPIDAEALSFLESVRGSWTVHSSESPDSIFAEISSVTGIQSTVDGVVEFHTHKTLPYSFFDFGRNAKESLVATVTVIASPSSIDGRVYHAYGTCFVKLAENVVEVFEDNENGLVRTLYMKAKSGEKSN